MVGPDTTEHDDALREVHKALTLTYAIPMLRLKNCFERVREPKGFLADEKFGE